MAALTDIAFPIGIVLIPLVLFVLLYAFYALFNLSQLMRYGAPGLGLYLVPALFGVGTVLLVVFMITALSPYDFTAAVPLSGLSQLFRFQTPGL